MEKRPKTLGLVFRRSAEFLGPKESYKLLVLNKGISECVMSLEFKREISLLILSKILGKPITDQNFQEEFREFSGILVNNYSELYRCLANSFNRIKNPCGESEFEGWKKKDGGDGWVVEDWGTWGGRSTVFVSSFGWCTLSQKVKIPPGGHRRLLVGSPVARRVDCRAEARLVLKVFKHKNEAPKVVTSAIVPSGKETSEFIQEWNTLCIQEDIDSSVYEVEVEFHGKDLQFWKGWYGARFGFCFLRLFNL